MTYTGKEEIALHKHFAGKGEQMKLDFEKKKKKPPVVPLCGPHAPCFAAVNPKTCLFLFAFCLLLYPRASASASYLPYASQLSSPLSTHSRFPRMRDPMT